MACPGPEPWSARWPALVEPARISFGSEPEFRALGAARNTAGHGPTPRLTAVALVCALLGCRTSTVAHAVDPEAASCIPADTVVLAGVSLDRLRAAPLYAKLPATVTAIAGAFTGASSVLLAFNGKDLLAIARGQFAQAPAGATLAAPNLALFGTPQLVAAAMAQRRLRTAGAPALLAHAESIASGPQIWIVIQGGVAFPLSGNAANLNQLLHHAESATVTASFDQGLALEVTAIGRTADAARNIEETVRADITLAAAAEARQPDLAKLLRSIRIDREDRSVRITLSADQDAAAKLLAALAR
jgi:hypothetical protein